MAGLDTYQLFPALDPAVEAALRSSIKRFGVLVPIVKDQHGNVLDGHHRQTIADELGVNYRVDHIVVADETEARAIVETLNTDRGHRLKTDMRREVVADLREQGHSLRAIAGAVGVSQTQVRKDIASAELCTGAQLTPERAIGKDGKSYPAKRPAIVVSKSKQEAERTEQALSLAMPAPGRVVDVKGAERVAREAAAEARRQIPQPERTQCGPCDIRHGDFRMVLADLPDGSIDAIITDPPYPQEYIPLFGDLGALAARVLKPGGVLAAMTGQLHLPRYMDLLGRHLAWRWCGAYITTGAHIRVHAARVASGWKPILIYERSDAIGDGSFFLDFFRSNGDDKDHHEWGQSESGMASLINALTKPGATVLDPFLGGGTTALACRDLGRNCIGCDIDAAAVATTRERLA